MMAFIAFRQKLDRKTYEQMVLYEKLSRDLFHYNIVDVDYTAEINKLKSHKDLKPTWGKRSVLHQILVEETNKYLSGNQTYDPYAVAITLRLRIEKTLYDKLPNKCRADFVNQRMTKNKFAYCEENGLIIPDVYNIINAIHNEADHLSFNDSQGEFEEKAMVYKLQNNVVLNIIRKIFNWTEGLKIDASFFE